VLTAVAGEIPAMKQIPFLVGHSAGVSLNANAQQLVNLYFEPDRIGGRSAHIGYPGLKSVLSLPDGIELSGKSPTMEVRGLHVMGDYLYAVCGNYVVRVDSSLNKSLISTTILSTSSGPVVMADNGYQLFIAENLDKLAYVYDSVAGTWTQINEDDYSFLGGHDVAHQDGYFISSAVDSDTFYISSFNGANESDALAPWDPLQMYVANAKPGNIVRIISDHRELWVFKQYSTEVFYNSGDLDLTFRRMPRGNLEVGCASRNSVVALDNTLYWLADDRTIRRANGFTPEIISPPQIASQINRYSVVDDAVAFAWTEAGKKFYQITFPSADETWCYEVSTGIWSKRASYRDNFTMDTDDGRHRANCYAFFNGKHYVGDYSNGRLYEMDRETYTDNRHRIRRVAVGMPLLNDRQNFILDSFEVEFEAGVGLTPVSDADPDGVCLSQKPGSGGVQNLTINGPLASGGVADMGTARHVTITSTADDSGRSFTISGTDAYGEAVTETLAGPDAGMVEGAIPFATVTQVSIDDNSAGNITVGSASSVMPGEDPQAMLQFSKDGGHTWSYELWKSIGKIGEYTRRARWNRLGVSRSRTFRLVITDPVKVVILAAYFNGRAGVS